MCGCHVHAARPDALHRLRGPRRPAAGAHLRGVSGGAGGGGFCDRLHVGLLQRVHRTGGRLRGVQCDAAVQLGHRVVVLRRGLRVLAVRHWTRGTPPVPPMTSLWPLLTPNVGQEQAAGRESGLCGQRQLRKRLRPRHGGARLHAHRATHDASTLGQRGAQHHTAGAPYKAQRAQRGTQQLS